MLLTLPILAALPALAAEPDGSELDDETFRKGLLDYGLFDLLDYELRVHSPDKLTEKLLRRRMQLAIAGDESRDIAARSEALEKANRMLEELIAEHGQDARAIEWQLTLAKSLIYEQAEPYYASILYRGGASADQAVLGRLMDRAIGVLERLLGRLEKEYARLDEVTLGQYELLDAQGYVTELEQAMPQAAYMLRWARFYKALALGPDDPQRRALLERILRELTGESHLLTEKHSLTHVQAQSLLLAGMTTRLLADYESARRYLLDAVDVVEGITDPQERRDLQWLVTLASIEQVRTLRDSDRFDEAMQAIGRLRGRLTQSAGREFGHELVLALLEGSVEQARIRKLRQSGSEVVAREMGARTVAPLMSLAEKQPSYRDAIYATLYEQLRDAPEPEKLHPFLQCAVIAGRIGEATQLRHGEDDAGGLIQTFRRRDRESKALKLLDEAIKLAKGLIERRPKLEGGVYCEAVYNLAVAEYHRGRRMDAARRFSQVAQECPRFPQALAAATYGVEAAAELAEDPTLRARQDVQDLLVESLRTLVEGFEESEAARYWRFFYAQALEDLGRIDDAARQYALVNEEHPHYLTASFRSARCRVVSLRTRVAEGLDQPYRLIQLSGDAVRALQSFKDLVSRRAARGDASASGTDAARLLAEADVLMAEVYVLPGVDRPEDAIALLDDFERQHPGESELIGRVLRVRIIAYEATGQLQKAQDAVPRFLASDPEEAGATLQSLFNATTAEIDRFRKLGRDELAERKARAALIFAEQLFAWASGRGDAIDSRDLHALRVQLGEARLEAGQVDEALTLFRQAAEEDAAVHGDGQAHAPRVLMGLATVLARLDRCDEALPLFNRLYNESPRDSTRRFEALLGDLRCRTELGEDPEGIINAIRQHRYLHPDLGGEDLREEFERLQRRNMARGGDEGGHDTGPGD